MNDINKNTLQSINTDGLELSRSNQNRSVQFNAKIQNKIAKKRIYSLYINGLDAYQIHKETGFELSYCKKTVKTIKKDIEEIDKHMFFREVKDKILSMFNNHGMVSLELVKKFHKALDEHDEAKMIAYARELSRNDKEFSSSLRSMGVSVIGDIDSTLPPDQGPKNNKIVDIEYEITDVLNIDEVREEAKRSAQRLLGYMDSLDKVASTEVKITEKSDVEN